MLDLELKPNHYLLHEKLHDCAAKIHLADEVEADSGATPPVEHADAVDAEGVFRLEDTGNAVDMVITARALLNRAVKLNEPADITVECTASYCKDVVFDEAGDCVTHVRLDSKDLAGQEDLGDVTTATGYPAPADPDNPTAEEQAAIDEFTNNLVTAATAANLKERFGEADGVTLSAKKVGKRYFLALHKDNAKGKTHLHFEGAKVAEGAGRDPMCKGPFSLDPVGEVHIDAVCSWRRPNGLKPNPTHLRIRAMNPHKKVRTLGVPDGEYDD